MERACDTAPGHQLGIGGVNDCFQIILAGDVATNAFHSFSVQFNLCHGNLPAIASASPLQRAVDNNGFRLAVTCDGSQRPVQRCLGNGFVFLG